MPGLSRPPHDVLKDLAVQGPRPHVVHRCEGNGERNERRRRASVAGISLTWLVEPQLF